MSGQGSERDQWKQLGEDLDGALGRMAKWLQKRPNRTSSLAVVDSGETVRGRWAGLASAVQTYAVAAAGIPGADSATSVLMALYGVEDAQAAMLRSIDRQVRLLREGPFRSGQLLLREAGRVGPKGEEYSGFLAAARDRFYDAHGLAASVQERALTEFHLGTVAFLRGKTDDAKFWLGQCHESGTRVVGELASRSQNIKVLRSRKTTAALALSTYGIFVVPAKLKKVWNAELAAGALQSFVPFVNCVADSLNAVSGDSHAPTIQFRSTGPNSYEVWQGHPDGPDGPGAGKRS